MGVCGRAWCRDFLVQRPCSGSMGLLKVVCGSFDRNALLNPQTGLLQVLKLDQQMQQLAKKLQNEDSLLVFGRGYNYATALEAALKVS